MVQSKLEHVCPLLGLALPRVVVYRYMADIGPDIVLRQHPVPPHRGLFASDTQAVNPSHGYSHRRVRECPSHLCPACRHSIELSPWLWELVSKSENLLHQARQP